MTWPWWVGVRLVLLRRSAPRGSVHGRRSWNTIEKYARLGAASHKVLRQHLANFLDQTDLPPERGQGVAAAAAPCAGLSSEKALPFPRP